MEKIKYKYSSIPAFYTDIKFGTLVEEKQRCPFIDHEFYIVNEVELDNVGGVWFRLVRAADSRDELFIKYPELREKYMMATKA